MSEPVLPQPDLDFFYSEARNNFLFYLKATDKNYNLSKVHVFLADKLQQVADRKIKRLIITVPPRMGKSRMVSQEFPTWLLGSQPKSMVTTTGYSYDFIVENSSKKVRDKLKTNETYAKVFPNTQVSSADDKENAWSTTSGGKFRSVGRGGALTGHGLNCLIIDDPVKDFEEAHSETIQKKIWNWFLSTAMTRLESSEYGDAVIVIIMTRWSRNDLVGKLLSDEYREQLEAHGLKDNNKWEVVNIEAIAPPNDILGRAEGEPLYPERFPPRDGKTSLELATEDWSKIRAVQDPYIWSAMYNGRPIMQGGNYIMVDRIAKVLTPPPGLHWVRFWDLACTRKKKSDYTASVAGALDESTGILYLRDGVRIKAKWPDAREKIKDVACLENIPVGIEAVGGFKAAFQDLEVMMPTTVWLQEYEASKDVMVRCLQWISMARNYKIALVTTPSPGFPRLTSDWQKDFVFEFAEFPDGVHDDCATAVAGVRQMIFEGVAYIAPVTTKYSQTLADRRSRSLQG